MTEEADRIAQIEAFKADFPRQLDAFVERRRVKLGNLGQWKIKSIKLVGSYPYLDFKQSEEKKINFSLHNVPKNLTPAEDSDLRQHIKDICAAKGFMPYQPPVPSLKKAGTPEAWQQFADRNAAALGRNAKRLLERDGENPTILEPEDAVSMALSETHGQFESDAAPDDKSPSNTTYLKLFRIISLALRSTHNLRHQSNTRRVSRWSEHLEQPEYDGRFEKLEKQLPKILEEAKKRMDPRQSAVFDMIYAGADNGLSIDEIASQLGAHYKPKSAKITAGKLWGEVAEIIRVTAHQLGEEYEETADIIDGLTRINKRRPVIHRRSSSQAADDTGPLRS